MKGISRGFEKNRRQKGASYEEEACRYLIRKGLRILDRNYYFRGGEIDIIAQDGECIVFVEVKYRANERYGTGAEAVTPAKINRIRHGAGIWLMQNRFPDYRVRFDVISIDGSQRRHLKDCF